MSKTFQAEEIFEKAYVLIKFDAYLETHVLDHLDSINGIKELEYTTGAGCILVGISTCSVEELPETIVSRIQKIPLIYSTTTLIFGHLCLEGGANYE